MSKHVETDNIYEESLVAKRTICDYVCYIGGINNVDVSNKKLILAAAAHQKYSSYLNQLQKTEVTEEQSKK
jgi:antirestriction protein ArdC